MEVTHHANYDVVVRTTRQHRCRLYNVATHHVSGRLLFYDCWAVLDLSGGWRNCPGEIAQLTPLLNTHTPVVRDYPGEPSWVAR